LIFGSLRIKHIFFIRILKNVISFKSLASPGLLLPFSFFHFCSSFVKM
jgi:hypothetical protein